jgi:hypothetical protein
LYYIVERKATSLIYCGAAPDYCGDADDIDTSLCTFDTWGIADCTQAGCPPSEEYPEPCFNLYQSIPSSSYYALLNLFGEFPLIDQHSVGGKFVGTITAVVAVAVFALPVGIIGNGFEDEIEKRRTQGDTGPIDEEGYLTPGFTTVGVSMREKVYNFLHAMTAYGSTAFDHFINILVITTALTFMIDTLNGTNPMLHVTLDTIEFVSVVIFTLEYLARVYSIKEDPKYSQGGGRFLYMLTFLALVDLLSFFPYWCEALATGEFVTPYSDSSSSWSNLVKALRLLRILRFERYTHAFTSFDDVIRRNKDVLFLTAFTAILFWVFFGAFLYFSERDNPDEEMASNYNTVPNSMWMTLLNLSGEAPLCQYSVWGKVVTGILGLFATGIFGIPIGILGAGFEEVVEEENEDNKEELAVAAGDANKTRTAAEIERALEETSSGLGSFLEHAAFTFVNGIGSPVAKAFEGTIYALIFLAVGVGCWQTVEGEENSLREIEWIAVVVFTFEYLIRLVGVGADPEFATAGGNPITCRLSFLISFYSIVDLLAIIPFYVTLAMPDSVVNEYDEYLRMLRIIRLVKLDKYVPSISLIDDVVRLKFKTLRVAFFAAMTLWILFAALLYLMEHKDSYNGVDRVPEYGCDSNCTMEDRFGTFFDSMVYTGIHLTGDYPITTYTWPARFVNFFMVIAAVGVVSVPSGLIASGFVEIVQSKNRKKFGEPAPTGRAGDDWYEVRLRELQNVDPPPSPWGAQVDRLQMAVNEFLNGKEDPTTWHTQWTTLSFLARIFIFTVIIANVIAVLFESIPSIDKTVGNDPGNFFDVFEEFSVMVFAVEVSHPLPYI